MKIIHETISLFYTIKLRKLIKSTDACISKLIGWTKLVV